MTNIGSSVVVKYTLNVLSGEQGNATEIFKSVLQSLGRVIAVSLIVGSLIITGFILFIVPGVVMAIIFSLALPAMFSENLGVFASLRRSRILTYGVRWKTFTLLLIVLAILLMAVTFADFLSLLFFRLARYYDFLRIIMMAILISLVEPMYPVSITHLYYQVKRPEFSLGEIKIMLPQGFLNLE